MEQLTAEQSLGMSPLEQETKLQVLFSVLRDGFKKLEPLPPARQQAALKELTVKMQEVKA